ncbi:CatB-related O-acetyltransferase [Desulfoscipio gibsoniae]|uniref:Acetyltransferase (Isoleucine patch superfamily) n=1 Tax=Desulfoscipio gibsoniae DSM 7213 TaxID=767817 RepID=R4KJG6_9FIRM|nr:CatB-related O-acetyltransferase [Desulfoscipio gibsoniae]AGL02769.1 hypothetical protein Desgi_3426 [Desulfoscipio gibsoniae DSM 7213]
MLAIIGENSAVVPFYHYFIFGPDDEIRVGKYSGMSVGAKILGGGEHYYENIACSPMNSVLNLIDHSVKEPGANKDFLGDFLKCYRKDIYTKGPTIIGNDVLISYNATILSGIKVGDGAFIGAGAVVRKDVPPYAIVLGNPGRIAGYRFSEEQIKALLRIRWWDWSFEELFAFKEYFAGDVDTFIARALEKMEKEGRL